MGTEQGIGKHYYSGCIEMKPYEDQNTLVEQSGSLNYSGRTFISSLGSPFEKSWMRSKIRYTLYALG